MCPTKSSNEFPDKYVGNVKFLDKVTPESDVTILTSGGVYFPAHSHILSISGRLDTSQYMSKFDTRQSYKRSISRLNENRAMTSPVMEKMLEKAKRNRKTGEKVIPILGVPSDAVSHFLTFLYSSSITEEDMDKYGFHLLALSHVFSVPTLKQKCTKGLAIGLTIENVIDVLQLARLCDAPDLYLKGLKLVACKFKAVRMTEAWKFLQKHDPWLELEILQFINELESRKKRTKRHKEEQSLYLQLSDAMECLVHICTEGCTSVGPHDMDPTKNKQPCKRYSTCHGLQTLIRHFATCKKRVNGGCARCKRMWQLLKLHASMCDHPDHCRVPLCRQFKLKMQQEKKGGEAKWRMLVRKVLLAKTISSLSLPKGTTSPH